MSLARDLNTWAGTNLLVWNAGKRGRDEFREAVEDLISARTPENQGYVSGALTTLLDLRLPVDPGDSNAEIRKRWQGTAAYQHLTRPPAYFETR
jgi:hypothetical protein